MSLGLQRGVVHLVSHDPVWTGMFAAERARILAALGESLPLAVEHIGSTSIPGLVAKPVLDMLAGYPAGASLDPYIEALTRAGWVHRGENGIPGRHFFRLGDPRSYHLHMVVRHGAFWREHLAFRDALRTRPELRDAYADLKLDLARRFPRDRESYTNGKSGLVRRVVAEWLARAEGEPQIAQ